jgi:plasmid stabilization system protein ParE
MRRYEVVLAPAAQTQARNVAAWWRENRPAAPDLFDDEIAAVLDRLAEAPRLPRPACRTGQSGTDRSVAS